MDSARDITPLQTTINSSFPFKSNCNRPLNKGTIFRTIANARLPNRFGGAITQHASASVSSRANQTTTNVRNEAKLTMPRNTMVDLCRTAEDRHVGTSRSRLVLHNLQNFEIVKFLSARENINFPEL